MVFDHIFEQFSLIFGLLIPNLATEICNQFKILTFSQCWHEHVFIRDLEFYEQIELQDTVRVKSSPYVRKIAYLCVCAGLQWMYACVLFNASITFFLFFLQFFSSFSESNEPNCACESYFQWNERNENFQYVRSFLPVSFMKTMQA